MDMISRQTILCRLTTWYGFPPARSQYSHFLWRVALLPAPGSSSPGPGNLLPGARRSGTISSASIACAKNDQAISRFSLEQALIARELQPEHYLTWVRLAHAYHGLQQWEQAIQAYQHCEQLLPSDAKTRAAHFTDFGYLLLFDLEQTESAYPKFQAAVASGQARNLALIGLARCEVRVGQGARRL